MSCFKYHPEYGHINELKYGHVFLPKGLNPDFLDSLKYAYSERIWDMSDREILRQRISLIKSGNTMFDKKCDK